VLAVVAGCAGGDTDVPTDTAPIEVLEGPVVTHVPPEGPFLEGETIEVTATAADEDGVDAVDLYHRPAGELPYRVTPLEPVDQADGTVLWVGSVSGVDVVAPGLEYYLRAFDRSDFRVPADFPSTGPDAPLSVQVDRIPTQIPYEQPFEGTDTAFGVYELGWTEDALGFRGQRWAVDADFDPPSPIADLGAGVAVHGAGFAGIQPVDDWLISPPFDLSTAETAEVRFRQYGERTDQAGVHGLYASTGSPDPDAGDFVLVAQLPVPPEGGWETPPVVDLSGFVGERSVTLAWRYEGAHSDLWAIDDVRVRRFGPDLRFTTVNSPRLDPGTDAALAVTLTNLGAATAGPIEVQGAGDPLRVAFPDTLQTAALSTGASVDLSLPLSVADDHPDNTPLPVVLTATDGVDTGALPVDLLVGDPSRAIARVHTLDFGSIRAYVGVGNPVQPHLEETLFTGNLPAGVHTFSVDIAPHQLYLPSEPGRLRWYLRIETGADALVQGFGIDYEGAITWTDEPVRPLEPQVESIVYLPGRARPVVASASVDPDPLIPGEPNTLSLTLRNDGGATTGATFVRASSSDPDLAILAADQPIPAFGPGDVVTVAVPVEVDAGHTDGAPIPFTLTVYDDIEVFPVPIDLPVPWPDVVVGTGQVFDPQGNGNNVLDPGETANLVVSIRNDGALATGGLTCSLTQTGGPTATLGSTGAFVGVLQPGQALDASFVLTATTGAVGDVLSFGVSCESPRGDGANTIEVALGGQGWSNLPLDPVGDVASGGTIDLREGRWRVDGDTLSIELTSATDLDPANTTLEVWGLSAGSSWSKHLLTVQGDTAELYGELFGGFTFLADVPLTYVDADTLRLDIDIPSMEIVADEFALGVGAGFCATGTPYCDQWPDGWGNPYAPPIDTQSWFLLDW
jgi:hypothetical protein